MIDLDLQLQRIRQVGDIELRRNEFTSENFISNPPHRVGIAHLSLKPRYLLADDTGTGKTPQLLISYSFLKVKARQLKMLAVVPNTALFQWKTSVELFNLGLKAQVVSFDEKTGKFKGRAHRHKVYETSDADVLLLTYHTMARDIDAILHNIENFVVVLDEVQAIANVKQKLLYPAAQKLSAKARYIWGASATPIQNRLEELYAIMSVIAPGLFGSLDHFKRCYYVYAQNELGYWQHVSYKNIPQLLLYMRPYYIKRRASEVGQYLPKIVFKPVMTEMEGKQTTTYEDIVHKYFPGNEEMKARKLTKLASLTYAQMVSDAPACLGLEGDSAKSDELIRLLNEEFADRKVIIYAHFEKVVTFLATKLLASQIKHVRITGKENPLVREQAKVEFNTSEDVNRILINDAGREALNLQPASVIIFYDLPYSWGKFYQILGRARRRGSNHENILVVLLMNRGTIDEHVFSILKVKERLVANTFGIDEDASLNPQEDEQVYSRLFEAIRGG